MRRFNAPPGWPPPPNVRWRPPKHWAPAESWPAAPAGWAFWINEHGRRVTGPIGRYGGPSRAWPVGGAVVAGLLLFGSCQVLGGNDPGGVSADSSASGSGDQAEHTPATPSDPTQSPAPARPTPTASDSARTPAPFLTTRPLPTTPVPTPEPTSEPATPSATPSASPTPAVTLPVVFYKNCGVVRAAGKAPLLRGQPGYSLRLDRDGDGIACARAPD